MSNNISPEPALPASPGRGAGSSALKALFGGHSDNADLLKSLFLGMVVTAFFYEVFPLPFIEQGRILTLFDNPISELITGMTFWSAFVLLFKYLGYRAQAKCNQAFADPGIQEMLAQGIYARNVDLVLGQIKSRVASLKAPRYESSVIFRRIFQVLHYIRSLPKKESVNDLLEYQGHLDVKRLDSSYTLLQVFIWAIPILGFIGTVLGIGEAVNKFSLFIQTAESGAQFSLQMRNALGGVTGGLAVAFNTTFLALVLVIPVMIATSLLQKNEEQVLMAVEEYCLEELLPHLHIAPSHDAVTETFDEHMHRIMQLSQAWLRELEPLIAQVSEKTEMVGHQLGGVQPLVKEFTDRLLAQGPASPSPRASTSVQASAPATARKKPARATAKTPARVAVKATASARTPTAKKGAPARKTTKV